VLTGTSLKELPMRANWLTGLTCLCAVLLPLGACSSSPTGLERDQAVPLVVRPDSAFVEAGGTLRLDVLAERDGAAMSAMEVAWVTSDERIASVAQGGVVRGVKAGRVLITAVWQGRQGVAVVTVVAGSARCPLLAVASGGGSFDERAACE